MQWNEKISRCGWGAMISRQFTCNDFEPRSFWYWFEQPQRDESRASSHYVVVNQGPLLMIETVFEVKYYSHDLKRVVVLIYYVWFSFFMTNQYARVRTNHAE